MNWSNLHDVIDWCKKNVELKGYLVGEIKISSESYGFRVTIVYVPSIKVSAILPRKCFRYTVNFDGKITKKEEMYI